MLCLEVRKAALMLLGEWMSSQSIAYLNISANGVKLMFTIAETADLAPLVDVLSMSISPLGE